MVQVHVYAKAIITFDIRSIMHRESRLLKSSWNHKAGAVRRDRGEFRIRLSMKLRKLFILVGILDVHIIINIYKQMFDFSGTLQILILHFSLPILNWRASGCRTNSHSALAAELPESAAATAGALALPWVVQQVSFFIWTKSWSVWSVLKAESLGKMEGMFTGDSSQEIANCVKPSPVASCFFWLRDDRITSSLHWLASAGICVALVWRLSGARAEDFFVGQVVKTSGLACTSCEPGASGNLCESFFGKRSSSDSFLMEENPSLWDWELGIGVWGNHCDVGNLWTCELAMVNIILFLFSQKRRSNSLVFLMRVWIFNPGVSAKLDAKDGGL